MIADQTNDIHILDDPDRWGKITGNENGGFKIEMRRKVYLSEDGEWRLLKAKHQIDFDNEAHPVKFIKQRIISGLTRQQILKIVSESDLREAGF